MGSNLLAASAAIRSGADIRQLGAPVGLLLASLTTRAQHLLAIEEIRSARAYKQAGLTWDEYCRSILNRSPNAVEEDLANLSALGAEVLAATEWAGLKRADLRELRRLPDEQLPKLLPSGEIQVGASTIPLDASHKDAITEAIQALTQELSYLRNKVEDAESLAGQKDQEIEERGEEISTLKGKLSERRAVEKQARVRNLNEQDLQRALFMVAADLGGLVQRVETEYPDREMVLGVARVYAPLVSRLLDFGRGRIFKELGDPVLDPDAVDDALRAWTASEAAYAAEEEGGN